MKFGLVFQPSYLAELDGSYAEALGALLDTADLAEELGFDGVWCTEHHFQAYGGLVSAPAVVLSAIAQRTRRIRLGSAVSLLPLHQPLRIAEEWATLDVLSGGRLDFGVGRGSARWEYHNFGVDPATSRVRFNEALDVILQAWTLGRVNLAGQTYAFDDVEVMPRPLQQPHPPVWVATADSDESALWAADHGYHLMIPPYRKDFSVLGRKVATYQHRLREHSFAVEEREVFAILRVYVAASYEQARVDTEAYHYRYLGLQLARDGGGPTGRPAAVDLDAYVPERFPGATWQELAAQSHLVVGSPTDCVATLRLLHERLGITYLGAIFAFGGLPLAKVRASMDLFMREVAPQVRNLGPIALGQNGSLDTDGELPDS